MNVEFFINLLKEEPSTDRLFNPWRDADEVNDAFVATAYIRCENLRRYLEQRVGSARILLLDSEARSTAEKFTGIPLCSEQILLGHCKQSATLPDDVFNGEKLRTSHPFCPIVGPHGAEDARASLIWSLMNRAGWAATDWLAWNAFPFHPHDAGMLLTNRPATDEEQHLMRKYLNYLLALFPQVVPLALSDVAAEALTAIGRKTLRLPATAFQDEKTFQMELARYI